MSIKMHMAFFIVGLDKKFPQNQLLKSSENSNNNNNNNNNSIIMIIIIMLYTLIE